MHLSGLKLACWKSLKGWQLTKSSISIDRCISSIRKANGLVADECAAAIKESILKELHSAICKTQLQRKSKTGKIVVHVLPRCFQFYGRLGAFMEDTNGEYRLDLPVESWIISDRNLSKNEFSVKLEWSIFNNHFEPDRCIFGKNK